ncbi:39S mitochondrial ribosomal protein L46 domain containing protein [Naviculisporaceae sp. PSN 640]
MADQCIVCLDTLEQAVPSSPPLPPPDPDATSAENGSLEVPLPPKSVEQLAKIGLATSTITGSAPHQHTYVAEIEVCGHQLHDACLREWTEKANSCPICRQTFHSVKVYDKVGGKLLATRQVQDKKQVPEFDFQAWADENPDQEDVSVPCPVCQRADNEEILLLCDACDTPYHTHCIGLEEVPEGHWYCMECVDAIGPALTMQHSTVGFGVQPGGNQNRLPRRSHFPRTQARMRRARQQAQADSWQGAWGRITGRIWDALNIDVDYQDQEDDEDFESLRRSQHIREEEAREIERWEEQQRINIASRLGAREVFERNLPRRFPTPPAVREPPAPESREERRAWGALERAREMEGTSGVTRKRKSRSNTPEVQEAQHEPERRLKRPRTRRLPTQNGEASSTGEASSSNQPNQNGPTQNGGPSRSVVESAPSFLSSLLKEVEMSTPSDEQSLEAYFGPIPGANDASSPVGSPSPSGHSSPRASSITPPPNEARSRSPQMALSSHIAPIYPPANFSPTRSISPKKKGPTESRPSPDNSDAEHREHRGRPNGTTEIRHPRPRRAPASILSRSDEVSPTRSGLPMEMKESISSIVRGALRPHWRASQLTAEQYEIINRSVSHKLYQEVKDFATTIPENARESWEKLATKEGMSAPSRTSRASAAICSQCRRSQQPTVTRQPLLSSARRFYSSEAASAQQEQQPAPPAVDVFEPSAATAPVRYRIKSGIILTRPPLLTKLPTPFESAFYLYQKRLNERLQARFRPAMYFKKDTAPELDWKIKLKERRGVPGKDIGRYNPHGRMAWNDEVLVGSTTGNPETIMEKLLLDAEQRVSDDGEILPDEDRVPVERPMPRRTEADEKNDVRRLDRRLDETLYFVVEKGGKWQFPAGLVPTEEALHETAARVLAESAGVNMNTWIVGRVPVAHIVNKPVPAQDAKSKETPGEKIFFLKGRIMAGQADLKGNKHELTDFKWLTKDELRETLPQDYFKSIRNMLELR